MLHFSCCCCCWTSCFTQNHIKFQKQNGLQTALCVDFKLITPFENPSSQRTNQMVWQSPAVLLTLRHFREAWNHPVRRHQRWAMFDINLCHSTSQGLTQSKSHKLSLRRRIFDKWVSIRVKSDNTRSVRSRGERQTEKWFYAICESVTWRRQSIRLSKSMRHAGECLRELLEYQTVLDERKKLDCENVDEWKY